jgi:hypothetical protein
LHSLLEQLTLNSPTTSKDGGFAGVQNGAIGRGVGESIQLIHQSEDLSEHLGLGNCDFGRECLTGHGTIRG